MTEELQKLLGYAVLLHYNNFRLFWLFCNASVTQISRGGRCRECRPWIGRRRGRSRSDYSLYYLYFQGADSLR